MCKDNSFFYIFKYQSNFILCTKFARVFIYKQNFLPSENGKHMQFVQSIKCMRSTCEGSLLQPALAQLLKCSACSRLLVAPAPSHCCVKVPFRLILAPVPAAGKRHRSALKPKQTDTSFTGFKVNCCSSKRMLTAQHYSLQGQAPTHTLWQAATSIL